MTRINTIDPTLLLDQHLMAEYRELPMIHASLKRSLRRFAGKKPTKEQLGIPKQYTLGKGHIKFFYDKGRYLSYRWDILIFELHSRGYKIFPSRRDVDWRILRHLDIQDYIPSDDDILLNASRIICRFVEKPHVYTYWRNVININEYIETMEGYLGCKIKLEQ